MAHLGRRERLSKGMKEMKQKSKEGLPLSEKIVWKKQANFSHTGLSLRGKRCYLLIFTHFCHIFLGKNACKKLCFTRLIQNDVFTASLTTLFEKNKRLLLFAWSFGYTSIVKTMVYILDLGPNF